MSDDEKVQDVTERLLSNSWDKYIGEPRREGRDWMAIADTILADGRCVATELLALRRRVAELEATAARRLDLLRPFAGLIVHDRPNHPPQWPLFDTLADSAEHEPIDVNVGHVRAAAAEVAEKGADRG